MTDIRSPKWREEHGLSKAAADDRVDAAIDLIDKASNLFPIGTEVDAGEVRDGLSGMRIVHPNGGNAHFGPDYLCFLAYSYLVLSYIAKAHPDAEKVDFIIESNGRITKYIQALHSGLAEGFAALQRLDLAKLIGELVPAGKERVPVQAADVLCWHTACPRVTMDEADIRRYTKLARKTGIREELSGSYIKELAVALMEP